MTVLRGEASGVGDFLLGLFFEEFKVDGLWAVCAERGNVQGEAEPAVESEESGGELHVNLLVVSLTAGGGSAPRLYTWLETSPPPPS